MFDSWSILNMFDIYLLMHSVDGNQPMFAVACPKIGQADMGLKVRCGERE